MLLWLFWHVTYRTSGQFSSLLSDMLLIQNIFTRHPEVESQVCQFPFHVSSLENWKLQFMSTGNLIAQCSNLTYWNKITTKMQKMMPGLYETKLLTKKKKRVTLFPTQKLGLGGLVLLNHWWSTDQQLPVDLHRQSYCIITLTFPWTCPGLQSKKAILGVFTLCNFQFSQFSELQVSTFLRNIYIRRKVLNKGLIFWFPWTLQQDFKCCWNCQKRKMCVIVLQMIT